MSSPLPARANAEDLPLALELEPDALELARLADLADQIARDRVILAPALPALLLVR